MEVTEEDIKEVMLSLKKQISIRYYGSEIEDMISAAFLGVTKALSRFDSTKASFKTYAFKRGMGEALDYIRDQPSIKHRNQCKRAKIFSFSEMSSEIENDEATSQFTPKFENKINAISGDYDLQEIKSRILDYYACDVNTSSEIKAKIVVDHFIEGIPKYKLAVKYNVTPGCITRYTDEDKFMEVLNKVLDHCLVS